MTNRKNGRRWRYLTLPAYLEAETEEEKLFIIAATIVIIFLAWLGLAFGDCQYISPGV